MYKGSDIKVHILANAYYLFFFLILAVLLGVKHCLVVLIFISLMANVEHLFVCYWPLCVSLEKCLFIHLPIKKLSCCLPLSCKSALYILGQVFHQVYDSLRNYAIVPLNGKHMSLILTFPGDHVIQICGSNSE